MTRYVMGIIFRIIGTSSSVLSGWRWPLFRTLLVISVHFLQSKASLFKVSLDYIYYYKSYVPKSEFELEWHILYFEPPNRLRHWFLKKCLLLCFLPPVKVSHISSDSPCTRVRCGSRDTVLISSIVLLLQAQHWCKIIISNMVYSKITLIANDIH